MSIDWLHLSKDQPKEAIKDFLVKELNTADLAQKTSEEIEKNPHDIMVLKNMLEDKLQKIFQWWEKLDIDNPIDVKRAKMLISYWMLEYWDIDGFFPQKVDEQINRASRILEQKHNEILFNERQRKVEKIVIENVSDPLKKDQVISCYDTFSSWNEKFDTLLLWYPLLKEYLDLQKQQQRLSRLSSMIGGSYSGEWDVKYGQLSKEIDSKREALWIKEMKLRDQLFDDSGNAKKIISLLTNISILDFNASGSGFYEIKELILNILRRNNDHTFSYRDLDDDNGVHTNDVWVVTISEHHIVTDNVQIVSVGLDGIVFKNKVTGAETVLSSQTINHIKILRDQLKLDRIYVNTKTNEIAKRLNINLEESWEWDRNLVRSNLIVEALEHDWKLFEIMWWEINRNEGWRFLDSETWKIFNNLLQQNWITNIDCARWRTKFEAKILNWQKMFVLNQWDIKVMISFGEQPQVEERHLSQQEINEPINEEEYSSAYRRAEYEINNPKDKGQINLSSLWLTSKEVCNLLANSKLREIQDLNLNLSNNEITTVPVSLFSMKNLSGFDLSSNLIKRLPEDKDIDPTQCEKLISIWLENNNLEEIPTSLLKLNQLQKLLLSNNELSDISSSIDQLSHLEKFTVSDNEIHIFPDELTNIIALKELSMTGCWLDDLPINMSQLINLKSLNLWKNKLKRIPDISTMKWLWNLDISDNCLTSLPSLGSLQNLLWLDIEDNDELKVIPDDIKTLPKLKSEIKLFHTTNSGEEVKDKFIDGSMSHSGYKFQDGANKFFLDDQQYKYTFVQWASLEKIKSKAYEKLWTTKEQSFLMTKKLANGNYSIVVFSKASDNEYYKKNN
jgi:hypothetical protein